jgi:hypothetical protein
MVQVPTKPAGEKYFVLLRTPDYSGGHTAVVGGLGRSSQLPPLAFTGTRCVCCSQPAQGTTVDVPMTSASGRFSADPVTAPCCPACQEHALANTSGEIGAASLLIMSLGGGVWGAAVMGRNATLGGTMVAVAATLLGLGVFLLKRMKRKRLETTRDGHFPGLAVLVSPRQRAIHTRNRDVAVALVESHADFVAKAR